MNETLDYKAQVESINSPYAEPFTSMLSSSNLPWEDESVSEIWTSSLSSHALSYSTHGLYRYYGKFPSYVGRELIETYTNEKDLVWDPMCGSGTTGVEAKLLKRKSICTDINPVSLLITNAKTTYLPKEEVLSLYAKIEKGFKRKKKVEPYLSSYIKMEHWFSNDTIMALSKLRKVIVDLDVEEKYQTFFFACFLSIIRRVSKATTQQGRLFLDVETQTSDVWKYYSKKCEKMIDAVSKLPKSSTTKTLEQSAKDKLKTKTVPKLIICHPPYFNSYKYSRINSLELTWLNKNHADLRKSEIKEFFKRGVPEKYKVYIDDMVEVLKNLSEHMDGNSRLALMIGDAYMKETYIPLCSELIEKVSDFLEVEKQVLRIPKFTEASFVASQRRKTDTVGVTLSDMIFVFKVKTQ